MASVAKLSRKRQIDLVMVEAEEPEEDELEDGGGGG